jgi:benzil reductase ((S)-benzoin forming)
VVIYIDKPIIYSGRKIHIDMKHIIITGHSKGLGAGIATELLDENHHIHGISRTDNVDIEKLAIAKNCKFNFYSCDVSKSDTIGAVMDEIFYTISGSEKPEAIYLINNAGVVTPIGPLQTLDPDEIDKHFRINLLAPTLFIRDFIRHTADMNIEKRIINISSGAAVNPYHGLSVYCVGKAGMDMLSRSVALEQKDQNYPVEVMSVAPGIIDTDMQTKMRAEPEQNFKNKQKFVALKESGQLVAPEVAGRKLIELLFSDDFENGAVSDIRELYYK